MPWVSRGAGLGARLLSAVRGGSARFFAALRLLPRDPRATCAAAAAGEPPAPRGTCAGAGSGPRAQPSLALRRLCRAQGSGSAAAASRGATFRTWAAAAPLAMAAKVDLNTSTDWKEAKAFLKGLSDKQREEHYFCRDFIRLKKIPTWKEMAKGAAGKEAEEPQYRKDKALNEKLSLFRGDITKLEVDAIVNAANSSLLGGGGVDGCIHRAAGHLLTEECRTLHSCETGKAKITGGYRLPAKHVIHTVGPIAQGEPSPGQAQELRGCYLNSLQLALENRLRSVAFPCISTGVFGYPNEAAAEVVLGTLREWLEEHKDKVDRLVICVFLEKDEEIYRKRLPHFFPAA
ncbi:ADP-ribose glycohydrolase MACROD1 isoform X2 [Monodelphis domestica]|uniref:ADP-ribose glycohydrolase MACROD1 isoform X2 n=1 Tax=Monodelphis domestica TaxID=13616 RepID=UPI0024E22C11|nr:ADP-ribose glycohydrolase MACROD1 isoform X2 [Monodelphis domestica]